MSTSKQMQQQQQRVNPEFKGITQKYSKLKQQRNDLDKRKHSLQTNLNYFERTRQSIDQKLKSKRDELKWLKSVRDRHLSDIRYKMEQEEFNNQKLDQLKMEATNARKKSQKNILAALHNSRQQKLKTTQQVKRQLDQIKRIKRQQKQQLEMYYTIRSKQLQQEKSMSKSKINKFYRRKNKILLNSYRQMIKNEQIKSQQSQTEINFMQNKTVQLDDKIKKKKQKLRSIEDQILRIKIEAADCKTIHNQSVQLSRITRRSSKPFDLLVKDSYTTDFPKTGHLTIQKL